MLFNSYLFLFGFLPCVLAGWWLLRAKPLRLAFLTGASWFFYAWWDWRYLPVLIGATSVDYVAGLWIFRTEDERRRRLLLAASLTTNIGILVYFKYAGFFLDTLNGIGSGLGLPPDLATLHIVLPIGISLLHLQLDVVHDRHLPPADRADPERPRVHDLRRALPAPDRGADRPLHRPRRPAAPADAAPDLTPRGARRLLPLLRPRQEAPDRRPAPPLREPSLLRPRPPRLAHGLGGRDRLLAAALLRLLRLLGHGRRARLAARLPLPAELQLAVQGREHLRLLATLAHEPVLVVPRLPVHPPRRLAAGARRTVAQPVRRRCSSPGSGTAPPGRSSSGDSCTASSSAATPCCDGRADSAGA